jgi:membrane protein
MFGKAWNVVKDTVNGFLADELVSRGASIAYFTLFSIAPLLVIIIAIAGLVFGQDAAQRAILGQFGGLMGKESADAIQGMIKGSNAENNGAWATLIGVGTLLLTASGAFGEIQSSLNKIWKAEPKAGLSRVVRARIAGLGLVLTLAFLMIASLVVSAGLAALSNYLNSVFPAVHVLMAVANS